MILTLFKARKVLKTEGFATTMRRGVNEIRGAASAYMALRQKPRFKSLDDLVDYTSTAFHGFLCPYQVRWEILSLLELVHELKPRTVLEIGTAKGGTLFLWTRVVSEDASLISIDLPAGNFGDGYVTWRIPIYHSFGLESQHIHLLRGDSHSNAMYEKTKQLLGGIQVDFLFIDAGHTYKDVSQDFEMYSKLVAPGGLIAFHDVAVHPPSKRCEVHRFWAELRSQYDAEEFIQNPEQGWAGIGYLRWDVNSVLPA